MALINWYPGHMAVANKNIIESCKKADLVIEVLDARAINTTSNKEILSSNKPILKIALKSDLADIKNVIKNKNLLIGSIKNSCFRNIIIKKLKTMLQTEKLAKRKNGIINPLFYLIVVGLPNIGKSSLINFLTKQHSAMVADCPATTKKISIYKIDNNIYIQDNPGVFFKKITNEKDGYILSLLNTINNRILPFYEITKYGYNFFQKNYLNNINNFYQFNCQIPFDTFLKQYTLNKHLYWKNNLDLDRAVKNIFYDFVSCKIGKVNYEK